MRRGYSVDHLRRESEFSEGFVDGRFVVRVIIRGLLKLKQVGKFHANAKFREAWKAAFRTAETQVHFPFVTKKKRGRAVYSKG